MKIEDAAFFDPTRKFMNPGTSKNGDVRTSQFSGLWRTARHLAGRDIGTGLPQTRDDLAWDSHAYLVEMNLNSQVCYVSILLYLILIDQLASILHERITKAYPKKPDKPEINGIRAILKEAVGCKTGIKLTSREIDAIVTLRHTLGHNFSLGSDPKKKGTKGCFRYEFDHRPPSDLHPEFVVKVGNFGGKYENQNDTKEITKVHV